MSELDTAGTNKITEGHKKLVLITEQLNRINEEKRKGQQMDKSQASVTQKTPQTNRTTSQRTSDTNVEGPSPRTMADVVRENIPKGFKVGGVGCAKMTDFN